jgi:chromosome segregation ATPase|nr:MAG TPA: Protein of unknown function (DUF3102) [Caudoviricetes sp.]
MNEITLTENDFDYSLVETEAAHKLKALSNQLDGVYKNYQVIVGEIFYKAQQELSSYGDGLFSKWVESQGFSRTNAYNYINSYKFVQNLNKPKKEIFDSVPKSLQFEMAKNSALEDANQAVFDGDITTRKEYKELERRLKLKEQALETVKGELERTKLIKPTEKVIEKEVIPDDYKATQELNKKLLAKNKELSESEQAANERVQIIESQLKELMDQRQEVDEKSAKYDELTRAIEQSQGQLDSYQKQVSAYRHTINFLEKGNKFLANFGGVAFLDIKPALSNPKVRTELETFLTMLNSLSRSVSEILEQDDVIEGEIL